MNCPLCKNVVVEAVKLNAGLDVLECRRCHGRWIQSYQYWQWREQHRDDLAVDPPATEAPSPATDSSAGKLCPECRHFLIRQPVGHGVPFQIDRCGHCGGIWLDRDEWETLEQQGLHDDLHLIFSTAWQREVRAEQHKVSREEVFRAKLGDEAYERILEIRRWLQDHPEKNVLHAYLADE